MRITDIHVDGFGVLSDLHVPELAPGLTLLYGPNEAGKSTLLDFVRGVIFGFPDKRSRALQHRPLRGGRHGGRLHLVDDHGRSLVLERYVGDKTPVLRLAQGKPLDADELRHLLGGADAALFNSVFGFGLQELSSFETLDKEEVRDLLFSAGVLGAGRSATRVMRGLEMRRAQLVRHRQQDAVANKLLHDLEALDATLRQARTSAQHYPRARVRVVELSDQLEELRVRGERLHRRLDQLTRIETSWPLYRQVQDDDQRLASLPDLDERERAALAHGQTIAQLASRLSGHEQLRQELSQLEANRAGLVASVARHQADLSPITLGELPEITDAHEQRARTLLADFHEARAQQRAAREEAERLALESRESATRLEHAAVSPSLEQLEELEQRAHELRGLLAQRDDLEGEIQRAKAARQLERQLQRRGPSTLRLALTGLGCALCLLVALLGASRHLVGLELAGAALLLGVVLWLASHALRPRQVHIGDDDEQLLARESALEQASGRVAQLAHGFALPPHPLLQQVDVVFRRLDSDKARALAREALAGDVARTAAREAQARERLEGASAHLNTCAAALERFAASCRLEEAGEDLLGVLGQVKVAQDRAGALARVELQIATKSDLLAEFEGELASLVEAMALTCEPETSTRARLLACESLLDHARAKLATRTSLEQARAAQQRALVECLGEGEAAEALREELRSGNVIGWQAELRQVRAELGEIEATREALAGEAAQATSALNALESSADIAALEVERASLVSELESALLRWTTFGLAQALLDQTLARYERERQPEVIARATSLFSKVTDGRYLQIVARDDEDGAKRRGVEVINASGARVEATALSRGTAEQLYLCLRLAFAATFAERSVALPLVLDDVLVNFDPDRARAMAQAIATTAEEHQVLAFTCHPHVLSFFEEVQPGLRVVTLARAGER